MLREYQAMDLRAVLPSIRVPTLVMQRRGDRLVPLAAAEQIASAMPHAQLETMDGDDHFLWHGDSEAVLRAVLRFTAAAPAWRLAA
jgi:pimeloyl-ACP methyl ester carboxylesterase